MRSRMLQTLVRLGQTGRAEQALAELGEDERASAEMRIAAAALRLASDGRVGQQVWRITEIW